MRRHLPDHDRAASCPGGSGRLLKKPRYFQFIRTLFPKGFRAYREHHCALTVSHSSSLSCIFSEIASNKRFRRNIFAAKSRGIKSCTVSSMSSASSWLRCLSCLSWVFFDPSAGYHRKHKHLRWSEVSQSAAFNGLPPRVQIGIRRTRTDTSARWRSVLRSNAYCHAQAGFVRKKRIIWAEASGPFLSV